MSPMRLTVVCDDGSHAPKVATVDRLELRDGKVVRTQQRHHAKVPAHAREDGRHDRVTLRCELCGLNATLRQATTVRLVAGLLAAGRTTVRLSSLAAMLSTRER